jgi:hypothetical protein
MPFEEQRREEEEFLKGLQELRSLCLKRIKSSDDHSTVKAALTDLESYNTQINNTYRRIGSILA